MQKGRLTRRPFSFHAEIFPTGSRDVINSRSEKYHYNRALPCPVIPLLQCLLWQPNTLMVPIIYLAKSKEQMTI